MGRAAFALISLLALLAIAWAQNDGGERARLEAEIGAGNRALAARRAEIDAITRSLGVTDATLRERIAERDRVSAQIADLEAQQVALQRDVASLRGDVAATEAEVAALEGNLSRLGDRISGLLIGLHRQRQGGYAIGLARAASFHDFAVQSYYVGLLTAQDVALIEELDALVVDLEGARRALGERIVALEVREVALRENARERVARRGELDRLIDDLRSTEAGQAAQRRSLLEAEEALGRQIGQLEQALAREIARLRAEEERLRREAAAFVADRERRAALEAQANAARERADNLATPLPLSSPAGTVPPVEGAVLLTRFGEGNNSFVSVRANAERAAVRAVRAGVVVSVAPIGANDGFLVAVRHDPSTTTVYTNLQTPIVAYGDAVSAGTTLGYLGGGTLIPEDVLRFYVRRTPESGEAVFVDPSPLLGL